MASGSRRPDRSAPRSACACRTRTAPSKGRRTANVQRQPGFLTATDIGLHWALLGTMRARRDTAQKMHISVLKTQGKCAEDAHISAQKRKKAAQKLHNSAPKRKKTAQKMHTSRR
eukprot:2226406-Rhodomonas_salina.2